MTSFGVDENMFQRYFYINSDYTSKDYTIKTNVMEWYDCDLTIQSLGFIHKKVIHGFQQIVIKNVSGHRISLKMQTT